MLTSTTPRLAGAALVLVLGWLLAAMVGRGVTPLLGAPGVEEAVRRAGPGFTRAVMAAAVGLVRLVTLLVVLDLLGRLSLLPAVAVILVVGWLALRETGRPVAQEASRWVERPPDRVPAVPSAPVGAGDEGLPVRSAYDRRRLARPGADRRVADGRG